MAVVCKVMNRKNSFRAWLRHTQKRRHQTCLPVMAMHHIRFEVDNPQNLNHCLAEIDKPTIVIIVIPTLTPIWMGPIIKFISSNHIEG